MALEYRHLSDLSPPPPSCSSSLNVVFVSPLLTKSQQCCPSPSSLCHLGAPRASLPWMCLCCFPLLPCPCSFRYDSFLIGTAPPPELKLICVPSALAQRELAPGLLFITPVSSMVSLIRALHHWLADSELILGSVPGLKLSFIPSSPRKCSTPLLFHLLTWPIDCCQSCPPETQKVLSLQDWELTYLYLPWGLNYRALATLRDVRLNRSRVKKKERDRQDGWQLEGGWEG